MRRFAAAQGAADARDGALHCDHEPDPRAASARATGRRWPTARGRRRRRRPRSAGGRAREALDQARVEDLRPRARDPDDGPDDARGGGHAGQGAGAQREGGAPGSHGTVDSVGRRGLRLSQSGARRPQGAGRELGEGRLRRDGLPGRAGAARGEACRRARCGRGRRGRDRHGHRPRRLSLRPDRTGVRRDRRGQGSVRQGPPEGHPRDGRARDVRRRPSCLAGRDRGRRGLHQDLDRQGRPGGDPARHALHARGDPGRPRGERGGDRDEARGRASARRSRRSSTSASCTRHSAPTG